jgi:hypothetical protein
MLAWERLNTCIVTDKMKAGIHIGYSVVDNEGKDRKPFGEKHKGE